MIRSPQRWPIWVALIATGGVAGYLVPPEKLRAWAGNSPSSEGPSGSVLASAPGAADPMVEFNQAIHPLLENHCGDCHGGGMRKGALDLDAFPDLDSMIAARTKWKNVRTHIASNLMPPPDEQQLEAEDKQTLLSWIDRALIAGPIDGPPPPYPAARSAVWPDRQTGESELEHGLRVLAGFLPRAFRRDLGGEEFARYQGLVEASIS